MGFYALDNYCPHRGCAVSFQSSGGFSCPCHGWTFDFNGDGSRGSMDHLAVCVDAMGNAGIDPNTTVSVSTRV
jgi:Rieske Fe-S protein